MRAVDKASRSESKIIEKHKPFVLPAILLFIAGGAGLACGCNSSLQSLATLPSVVNSYIDTGCSSTFAVPWNSCPDDSYLHVELWDVDALLGNGETEHGDPMLLLARGEVPQPYITRYSGVPAVRWDFRPPNTLWDQIAFTASHPFMSLQVDFMNGKDGPQNPNLDCDPGGSCWYIVVANIDEYLKSPLTYTLRVSCRDEPACPSNTLRPDGSISPVCGGVGECRVTDQACGGLNSCTSCACPSGFGGRGCEVQLPVLGNGVLYKPQLLALGQWDIYEVDLTYESSTVLVELHRMLGSPYLIFKRNDVGYEPYGLPAPDDISEYADKEGATGSLDYHHVLRINQTAGKYYVGVWNAESREMRQALSYTLKVTWVATGLPLCPLNCSSQGTCSAAGECTCRPGYGGRWCEGELKEIGVGSVSTGYLRPGQWAFYQLRIDQGSGLMQQGLLLSFATDGGNAIVCTRANAWPAFNSSSRIWWAGEYMFTDSAVMVSGSSLAAGSFFIAIYNLNYLLHQPFHFRLQLYAGTDSTQRFLSYIWILIGVCLTFLLCVAGVVVRRMGFARLRRRQRELRVSRGPVEDSASAGGLDQELLRTFPTFEYGSEPSEVLPSDCRAALVGGRGFDTPLQQSEAHPSCSVCLGDYEKGELILRLPQCQHDFHELCIRQWLTNHTSCPICRNSLLPIPPAGPTPIPPSSTPGDSLPQQQDSSGRGTETIACPSPSNAADDHVACPSTSRAADGHSCADCGFGAEIEVVIVPQHRRGSDAPLSGEAPGPSRAPCCELSPVTHSRDPLLDPSGGPSSSKCARGPCDAVKALEGVSESEHRNEERTCRDATGEQGESSLGGPLSDGVVRDDPPLGNPESTSISHTAASLVSPPSLGDFSAAETNSVDSAPMVDSAHSFGNGSETKRLLES